MASTTPDWIRREAERAEHERAASDAQAQQAIEDGFKIAKEGPAFWHQLLDSLTRNTDALPQIGLKGRTSRLGEGQCQVEVSKPGMLPNLQQLNLYYDKPGSPVIRVHANTLYGKGTQFAFVASRSGELAVVQEAGSAPMDAAHMADTIVKSMVNALRRS